MNKYDRQIEKLTKNPDLLYQEWLSAKGLFQFCSANGRQHGNGGIGCLTMIRQGDWEAETPELTEQIRADKRIPTAQSQITPEHFPVLKEWQEKMDLMFPGRGE